MKMCDCKKEIFIELAKAYIASYKRDLKIYHALSQLGIYVEDEQNPFYAATEKIFDSFGQYVSTFILDFAEDDYLEFEKKDGKKVIINSIEELYDYLFN